MNKLLIRLNIFLFLTWAQIIIFVISIIIATFFLKLSLPFFKKASISFYDGYRMALSFSVLILFQWIYYKFVTSFLKENIYSALTLISSQIISIFIIRKILVKTVFIKYQLSYIAIFICFVIPFFDYTISSFKKNKLKF